MQLTMRSLSQNNALNQALDGLTLKMDAFTIHDMRRTASTRLNGNGWPSDAIELALGHHIGGIRGIYNVAEYSAERKKMLQMVGRPTWRASQLRAM
jgi:integrase